MRGEDRLPLTARIISLTRDVRDRRDERDARVVYLVYLAGLVCLVDLPLRASHRKAKASVEVEGRKDAESDWSALNLSLNLHLLLW